MRIHVEGDIYISGTGLDFSLQRRTVAKEGKQAGEEIFTSYGYYTSVASCMKALLKEKIMESTATELKGLIADVERIETDLKALINF